MTNLTDKEREHIELFLYELHIYQRKGERETDGSFYCKPPAVVYEGECDPPEAIKCMLSPMSDQDLLYLVHSLKVYAYTPADAEINITQWDPDEVWEKVSGDPSKFSYEKKKTLEDLVENLDH